MDTLSIPTTYTTIFAVSYAFVCIFLNCVGNAIADRLNTNNLLPLEERHALPDLLISATHSVYISSGLYPNFPNHLIVASVTAIALRVATLGNDTLPVLRRILLITGTIYLMRAISVSITVLPNPLLDCKSDPSDSIINDALLILTGQMVTCGDVFFSGHTIIITLSSAVWITYCKDRALCIIINAASLFSLLCLIASSFHYSIDVFFGYLITMTIWNLFHWAVLMPSFKNFWWARVLILLDGQDVKIE